MLVRGASEPAAAAPPSGMIFARPCRCGDKQPGEGAQLITGPVPADTGVRDVLGDRAGDLAAERDPVEGDTLAERAGRVIDDDVAGPGGRVGSMRSSWMMLIALLVPVNRVAAVCAAGELD